MMPPRSPAGTMPLKPASTLPQRQSKPDMNQAACLQKAAENHAQRGNFPEAARLFRQTLKLDPQNAENHNNLGMVLHSQGALTEAVASYRKAIETRPHYAIALVNLGAGLSALERYDEAIDCYHQAIKINPNHVPALNNLGAALYACGRHNEAIFRFEEALTLDSGFIDAKINLAHALSEMGYELRSLIHYQAVLESQPENLSVHINIAELLLKAGRHNDAINHYRHACKIQPNYAAAHAGLGTALQEVGELELAKESFRRAIAEAPHCPKYYLCLAHIAKLDASDPLIPAVLRLAESLSSMSKDDQTDLHFALGRILANIGEDQSAFDHVLAGNNLKRQQIDYNEAKALRLQQRVRRIFTAEELQKNCSYRNSSRLPVFIVGMPRSGSTLVEQILASHPDVVAAGEVDTFREAFREAGKNHADWQFPEIASVIDAEQRQQIAEDYLRKLTDCVSNQPMKSNVTRITNKMLSNFRYIGLIYQLFPHARIIHTYRDPIDTCLSCFSIQFSKQPFSFDLGELGRHYNGYWQLMQHWNTVLPFGTILNVPYESVVENLEETARRIISYCELGWNDDCLQFYKTKRPVRTASVAQVRQPIYRSAIGRWRPDEEKLRPLLEGLALSF